MNSKEFDCTGIIGKSPNPTLLSVRLYLDSDDDELTIYDNALGPEYDTDIAYLNKEHPFIDFGEEGYFCHKGLYAFLSRGGKFRVVWKN